MWDWGNFYKWCQEFSKWTIELVEICQILKSELAKKFDKHCENLWWQNKRTCPNETQTLWINWKFLSEFLKIKLFSHKIITNLSCEMTNFCDSPFLDSSSPSEAQRFPLPWSFEPNKYSTEAIIIFYRHPTVRTLSLLCLSTIRPDLR